MMSSYSRYDSAVFHVTDRTVLILMVMEYLYVCKKKRIKYTSIVYCLEQYYTLHISLCTITSLSPVSRATQIDIYTSENTIVHSEYPARQCLSHYVSMSVVSN